MYSLYSKALSGSLDTRTAVVASGSNLLGRYISVPSRHTSVFTSLLNVGVDSLVAPECHREDSNVKW